MRSLRRRTGSFAILLAILLATVSLLLVAALGPAPPPEVHPALCNAAVPCNEPAAPRSTPLQTNLVDRHDPDAPGLRDAAVTSPRAGIAGVIRDERGTPMHGCRIEIRSLQHPGTRVIGRTAVNGVFRLEVPAQEMLELEATDQRAVLATDLTLRVAEQRDLGELELGMGPGLSVLVVDQTGAPVVGALVGVRPPEGAELPGHRVHPSTRLARTGADGGARLYGCAPGLYEAFTTGPWGVSATTAAVGELRHWPEVRLPVTIDLSPHSADAAVRTFGVLSPTAAERGSRPTLEVSR